MNTCPRCGASWPGADPAHCPTCHNTFADDAAYTAHRDRRRGDCRPPADAGLIRTGDLWRTPRTERT